MNNKIKMIQYAGIALLCALLSSSVHAVVIISDNGIDSGGIMVSNQDRITAGGSRDSLGKSSGGTNYDLIIAFKLPTLSAGHTIDSINFEFNVGAVDGSMKTELSAANLYVLRTESNLDNVTKGDYGNKSGGLIKDSILRGGAHGSTLGGHALGNNTTLLNWLSTNYKAGEYLLLSFQLKGIPNYDGLRYRISSGSKLTINTVPEPATYALIFGGLALAFVMLRRRFEL